jgi:drug/metabolite transporter (DMT)-like permease
VNPKGRADVVGGAMASVAPTAPVASAGTAPAQGPLSIMRKVPVPVLFVGVAFCWAMNSVTMKIAGRYAPPLSVAWVRALVGASLLLLLARRSGARWPNSRDEIKGLFLIGLFMTGLSTACLFLAAKHVPAGLVAIFANTMPLFTAMLAPFMLGERLTRRIMLGLAVGMAGTVLVAWRAVSGEIDGLGVVFGVLAGALTAIGSILYKKYPMPGLERRMVVGVQLAFSSVVLAVLSIPDDRSNVRFTWQLLASFAYLSIIGLALSFVMYSELLSRATAMQSGSAAYLSTVIGVVLGAVMLGERLGLLVLIGGTVTIVGVALVQLTQLRGSSTPKS